MTDRPTRYLRRFDEALAALPDDLAKKNFCATELSKWVERYQQWLAEASANKTAATGNPPTAWDYVLTIAGVHERAGRYA